MTEMTLEQRATAEHIMRIWRREAPEIGFGDPAVEIPRPEYTDDGRCPCCLAGGHPLSQCPALEPAEQPQPASEQQRIVAHSEAAIIAALEELLLAGLPEAAINQLLERALATARHHLSTEG